MPEDRQQFKSNETFKVGKTMKIPAKKVVKFSAGKAFTDALNLKKGKKK